MKPQVSGEGLHLVSPMVQLLPALADEDLLLSRDGLALRCQAVHELGGFDPECLADRFHRGQVRVRLPAFNLADRFCLQVRTLGEFRLKPMAASPGAFAFRATAMIKLQQTIICRSR